MKKQLKTIYDNSGHKSTNEMIKVEPTNEVKTYDYVFIVAEGRIVHMEEIEGVFITNIRKPCRTALIREC